RQWSIRGGDTVRRFPLRRVRTNLAGRHSSEILNETRRRTMKNRCVINTRRGGTSALTIAARSMLLGAPLALFCTASVAETHGYVISWFATATYNQNWKEACPEDRNGGGLQL